MLAHKPKDFVAPVFESILTKAPSKAQNNNIRTFQESPVIAATLSVNIIIAKKGFPCAIIKVPDNIPKVRDIITSLVTNAKIIAKSGGMIPNKP